MSAVREYLVYGVDDAHKHLWPVHYHLIRGDFLAAIDTVRKGANPLDHDSRCASALALCYELFFKTLNKCLNSTVPLGSRSWQTTGPSPPSQGLSAANRSPKLLKAKQDENTTVTELHGMADYNLPSVPSTGGNEDTEALLFTPYIEVFITTHYSDAAELTQNKLVRRLKGLLAVLKTMSERENILLHSKNELLRAIHFLEYPTLYASLMDYMFKNARVYGMSSVDVADVWDARRVWRAASSKDVKLQSLTKFISHIATLVQDLCGIFHVNIYSKSQKNFGALYSGHDRHLRLPGMDPHIIETLAHMAFVTNNALLFDAMVVQEPFLQGADAFKWTDLLSQLLTSSSQMRPFTEPLMRRSLRNNVEYRVSVPANLYKHAARQSAALDLSMIGVRRVYKLPMANSRYSYVKHFEQESTLLPECWPLIRVDGRGFTGFSRLHRFRKPNEPLALGVMNAAAAHVMSTFDDIVLAYGHSDEYRKILSSVVSTFSAAYCFHWSSFYPNKPLKALPTFDGRIVLYPRFEHIVNYFSWRHVDCHVNNQYNICFWCLVADGKSPDEAYKWLKAIQHTRKGDKNEYIFQSRGINYNNLPRIFRKGTTLVRFSGTKASEHDISLDSVTISAEERPEVTQSTTSSTAEPTPQSGCGDMIELTIGDTEISAISQKLDAICTPLGIGVVHCDNTSPDFWKAVAPSYDASSDVASRHGIATLSTLSRDQIVSLNAGSGEGKDLRRHDKKVKRSLSNVFGDQKFSVPEAELGPTHPDQSQPASTRNRTTAENQCGSSRICPYGGRREPQKRANSAPNHHFGYWYFDGHSKYEDKSQYRGRPLHETLHTEFRISLLSSNAQHLDLKGFMNLAFVLLVVINFRAVMTNFRKYGLLLEFPTVYKLMHDDWPLTRCCIKVHISIVFAWGIERFIAPLSTKALTSPVVFLQALNLAILLCYPYLTVVVLKTEPALSALMLATSVVWALKIYSFHHVCFDYRRAVCNGEDLSEICKTRMEARAAAHYPGCIKLAELYRFLIMPTVCFQFYYPHMRRVRWLNALKHFGQFLFLLAVARIIGDQYIVVTVSSTFTMEEFKSANFSTVAYHILDRMLLLSIPVLYCWLTMFAVIFHHWLNFLAEITRFGDRRFYGDWWNAACFGEYWRKWNLPIHQFIVRHISKPLHKLGVPWEATKVIVFTISAALHEYLISVPLGLGWTGYVFWAMMGQIPLLMITRLTANCWQRIILVPFLLHGATAGRVTLLVPLGREARFICIEAGRAPPAKMANVQLDGICRNLKSTIEDTDALYKSIQMGVTKPPRSTAQKKTGHTVRFGETKQHGRRWIPPMTEPPQYGAPVASPVCSPQHKVFYPPENKAVQQNIDYMTYATRSEFFRSLNVDLEGWTEAQRKVFYDLVAAAEREMHNESERLQREYSLQLEAKLEHLNREMAQAHGAVVAEVSELRLDRERLSFDEVENRRRSKLMQDNLHRLQKSYDNLMEECTAKSSEIVRLNSVLAATERSFLSFKQRMMELESDLNARLQQIDSLHEEVSSAYKQMEAASNNNVKSERALASTKNELKNSQDQLTELRLELESMQLGAQLAAGEKASLEVKVRSLEKEVSQLTAEKMRLELHVATLETGTIVSLKEQCKRLEEQRNLARVEAATCDKRQELAQAKRELEAVQYQCEQLTDENKTLLRENSALTRQLEEVRRRAKDCENDLFQLKCQAHVLKQSGHRILLARERTGELPAPDTAPSEGVPAEPVKPPRRDIFAPTMFDGPDAETQEKIDILESELTELHLEKDRMVSEMTRCRVDPKSPALERRRYHMLEKSVAETNNRIHEVSESIRQLQIPN
ncbi:putative tRNA(His) guanylyltransferase [Babesia sp. Xinjiang]|uniref:putative tRNA(His) guanylyltransferase n=1 Tax=Babesia sp. Xinjiang TaxID=462227 RepID=UPI000A25B83A|nr:putative tRNA(His) guanylyltransferase [Babesia sp. Xinjiang]ORM39674.1 putative tRNA(His) guanylyltransferase [Babesia sp. Xinjiang]